MENYSDFFLHFFAEFHKSVTSCSVNTHYLLWVRVTEKQTNKQTQFYRFSRWNYEKENIYHDILFPFLSSFHSQTILNNF